MAAPAQPDPLVMGIGCWDLPETVRPVVSALREHLRLGIRDMDLNAVAVHDFVNPSFTGGHRRLTEAVAAARSIRRQSSRPRGFSGRATGCWL